MGYYSNESVTLYTTFQKECIVKETGQIKQGICPYCEKKETFGCCENMTKVKSIMVALKKH